MMKYLTLIVVIFFIYQAEGKGDKENKTFVATRDWQEIPEGQGIPAGLHVRINLETGKKEAKLLDESNESNQDDKSQHQEDKKAALSILPETSKERETKSNNKKTKKLKHIDEALQRIGIDYTPKEKVENIIREYKSYEELKKSFEDMRKPFKTDAEIITQLIQEFQSSSSTPTDNKSRIKTQIQILESFNYLMSQYDNALVFVDKGGLEQVLLPVVVNTTQSPLKVEAMRVLGAMSQNNPKVQIKVFERNVGSHLSQIIMSSSNTEVLSAALYAFSSLLRKFPLAQQRILSTSGTQALISVLNRDCELKIKVKAIVIIGDLMREKYLSKLSASEDPLAAAQYAEISFNLWLKDHNYCDLLEKLLEENSLSILNSPDFLEYIVNSLNQLDHFCLKTWQHDSRIMELFMAFSKHLSRSQDEYHLEVAQLVSEFTQSNYPEILKNHDEL